MNGRFREPFNAISHLIAAFVSLAGMVVLTLGSRDDWAKQVSLLVYGSSLTLMLAASAAYHGVPGPARRTRWLRKIDHAAIFGLIAGTYTPLCFNLFAGFWRWGLLAIVWGIAIAGMISKAIVIVKSDWLIICAYMALGWLAVFGIGEILRVLPAGGVAWLSAGGMFYTVGAILSGLKRPQLKPGVFGHHEVWHLFVIGGAFCHYMLMLLYVV